MIDVDDLASGLEKILYSREQGIEDMKRISDRACSISNLILADKLQIDQIYTLANEIKNITSKY